MADPLSVASGVAGLLSLGIQVTQTLFNFYSAYKDQASDLVQITQNLENLLGIFTTLDKALQTRQPRVDEQELLQTLERSVSACNEVIKELQTECQKFQEEPTTKLKVRIQVTGRKATYPFRKSTLQKLEEDISDIRENLSLALNVLQLKDTHKLEEKMSGLQLLLSQINAIHITSTIRGWLMAPDATIDHNAACEKHHTGTGLWFVEGPSYADWLVKRNSFVWVHGFAGCGKSVLCSTAIQSTFRQTQHQQNAGIGFFYFSFTDASKTTASGMLRALLLQFSVQLDDKERDLEQLHAKYAPGTPPVEALLKSLYDILGRFHDSYILLDALDESPRDREREGVLRVIDTLRQWCLPGLHLLVTSRVELDIREALQPTEHEEIAMRNPENDRDILNFVSHQLSHDPKLQRWEARHGEIRERLADKSGGVFRYVQCQLTALKRARNRNQLDVCLRSLPRDLDETYERILCSIDESCADDVRRILTVLCMSKRLLTVEELIDAHAVNLEYPPRLDREGRSYDHDDLIDVCLGLIEVAEIEGDDGRKSSVARISHFSVQEYLESDRVLQREARQFAIQKQHANMEMAQICLVHLLEPKLSSSPLDEKSLIKFPLAHFAAMHWFDYFRESPETKSTAEDLIHRLFLERKSFETWVQLHDLDEPWYYPQFGRFIPSSVYYTALLGLDRVLNSLIASCGDRIRIRDMINAQGGRYGNALQAASFRGHEKMVQILLDQGADVNAQGGRYGNALQAASSEGHEKLVQILLDQGADVNAQGGQYGNALQAASSKGHKKLVQILIDRGASHGVGF
ncbi:hypothetical protein BDV19DRAFT_231391 [Aspergillus venezuelensis]